MILQSTDAASTNQFQQNMTAQMIAEVAKAQNPASPTDPLNTIDGISGPAYSFKKLNLSDLEAVGAYNLIANQSDQANLEVILWTSLYPPPKNVPTINDYYNFTAANWEEKSYVTLSSYLLAPSTSGTLTINSTDASKTPVINISCYEAASDMNIQILSLRRLRTLISQPEFSKYTVGPANGELIPGPNVQSDEDLATFIRETSVSSAHQSGTASMRPLDDESVVSSELKVYGVQGLRVVDASIMPLFIDQHPTAAIYMIAEKASAMIIEELASIFTGFERYRASVAPLERAYGLQNDQTETEHSVSAGHERWHVFTTTLVYCQDV
ncbi:hypothetical protein B0A55_10285 [Friedmanniomyces simplex]|uniref:Glucose-methanol-choline oxidoreductase C-terminal domain-containing protein n=1 Tax=Friedmanniomyces simplex TaxID=329884 RepID=A0A4U0WN55_9PEZI|nr:hypothetical protein B0A55_10285 [Friedmanniomyces simplex]